MQKIKTFNAIISTLSFETIVLYFLINSLKSIMLTLFAKILIIILLSIN